MRVLLALTVAVGGACVSVAAPGLDEGTAWKTLPELQQARGRGGDPSDCSGLTYAEIVLRDAPVDYWRLGEPSGAVTALDETGHHNGTYDPGTKSDPTVIPGAIVNDSDVARRFEDWDLMSNHLDRVLITWTPDFNPAPGFAIEAWANVDRIRGGGQTTNPNAGIGAAIYRALQNRPPTYPLGGFELDVFAETHVADPPYYRLALANAVHTQAQYPAPSGWAHVVGTYDPTPRQIRLFVNGELVGVNMPPVGWVPQTDPDEAMQIGFRFGLDNIEIDEVAYYTHALSNQQISDHYLCGKGLCSERAPCRRVAAATGRAGWPAERPSDGEGKSTREADDAVAPHP